MRRILGWLLLIPYAVGLVAGWLVLCAVVVWLAVCDGYAAGRRAP